MQFIIGIATAATSGDTYTTTGVAYYSTEPPFNPRGMSRQFMVQTLLGVVDTTHKDEAVAINAAVQRLVERLFIRGLVGNPVNGVPPVHVFVPRKQLCAKVANARNSAPRNHWILTGARRALEERQPTK